MKTVKSVSKLTPFQSNILFSYLGDRFAVFDIETMGLSPKWAPVILSAILEVGEDGTATVTQYFAEKKDDEKEILKATYEHLKNLDWILTYNGRHFDIPYISQRAKIVDLTALPPLPYNLDLYLIIDRYAPFKSSLTGLKQKDIEAYMGISTVRDDEITGKESAKLFEAYLKADAGEAKDALAEKILLHNHDDVLQLYRLLPLTKQCDMHKAFSRLGFPINSCITEFILKASQNSKEIHITGTCNFPLSYEAYSLEDIECHVKLDKGILDIVIPTMGARMATPRELNEFVEEVVRILQKTLAI